MKIREMKINRMKVHNVFSASGNNSHDNFLAKWEKIYRCCIRYIKLTFMLFTHFDDCHIFSLDMRVYICHIICPILLCRNSRRFLLTQIPLCKAVLYCLCFVLLWVCK